MEMESSVPPGFRFHPTEEELVGYYLQRKINSLKIDLDVIIDIDLYKIEPWDIQGRCNLGYDEQKEWYFFSHKDKKYPTGTRTNRATIAGFWKATGRDKAVLAKNGIIGMRKTLVFYQGRAPNGRKTDWIMHEYRLQTSELAPPHEEGWVVCRAFKKPTPNQRQGFEANWNYQYQPKYSYNTTLDNTNINIRPPPANNFQQQYFGSMQDLLSNNHIIFSDAQSTDDDQLPQLVSPNSISTNMADYTTVEANFQHNMTITSLVSQDFDDHDDELRSSNNRNSRCSIDWKNLDNLFVPPQIADTTSFMHSSLSTVQLPQNYDQDNRSNLLGCTFPDL